MSTSVLGWNVSCTSVEARPMTDEKLDSRRLCPNCKERALVPILYGPLPDSLTADRERGVFFWGGPVLRRDSPRWKCGRCQGSFPTEAVR
jgi:ribosomal protein S27AE